MKSTKSRNFIVVPLAIDRFIPINVEMLHIGFSLSWLSKRIKFGWLILFALGGLNFASFALAEEIRFSHFEKVALIYKIDPYALYAVSLVETKRKIGELISPYPWALNFKGKSYFFPTKSEAAKALHGFLELPGKTKPDVGIMQVNLRWHPNIVPSPYDLLDPWTGILAGGKILATAVRSTDDLELAYGRYHVWNDELKAREYGKKIISIATKIRAWREHK